MLRGFAMNTPPPEWVPREPTEQERTETWVEERFRELEFNEMQARVLAILRADWHEAERLLRKGATHNQVIDILT